MIETLLFFFFFSHDLFFDNMHFSKTDESGYLALPPCIFGQEPGLQPSQWIGPNTPMFSVKKNRNTNMGHYGEMASWQMRGVNFPEPNTTAPAVAVV